jgi:Lrp/AsnC family transcriptional regulator
MDRFDYKILRLLQSDASLTLAELSNKVGLSQTPCWKRVQRLEEKGVISRRVVILNPEALGFGLTVYVSIISGEHSDVWMETFTREVKNLPEVVEFYRMAGEIDYMLRVIVPEISAFDEFYKKLISIAPMKKVTSHFAMERIKYTTELPLRAE